MEGRIVTDAEETAETNRTVTLPPRKEFHSATRDMVLPAFMIRDRQEWRLVHYESGILSRVPWDEVDVSPLFDLELSKGSMDYTVRAGLEPKALVTDPEAQGNGPATTDRKIDHYFAASHLLDVMPNPWRGQRGSPASVRSATTEAFSGTSDFELRIHSRRTTKAPRS